MAIIANWLLIIVFVFAVLSYFYKFPKKDKINISEIPSSYCIQTVNRMDIQQNNECAAYSSAFILRHLGNEADGNKLYSKYPRKLLDGTVSPRGITVFFKKLDFDVSYYFGNANTLKKQISQGMPVIAFIKVFPDKRYLHFVPVVGYDDEYFYLADSLKHTINCDEKHYNRKILISDLEAVWKTWMPFCKNSYIVIHQKQSNMTTSQDQNKRVNSSR
ncbi:cysteine peptidase family C39 domain-containing protein [Paenibacillus sp. YIM B09110]|uniref:cysteine peptidase family C39 domain-containing protein n=1 Tax=Paenibacillus sp. YIM B09110 TaxID=3126102 RepID=UPI00301DE942